MRRAAVEGVLDYSKCDPEDEQCWYRHQVLLEGFSDGLTRELRRMEHVHYSSMAAGSLTQESRDAIGKVADDALNAWWKLQMPWMADEIGKNAAVTGDEQLAKRYREQVGEPGTPEHAEIMAELAEALRPLSRAEKLRQRRLRQAAAAATRLQNEATRLGVTGGA